MMDCTFASGKQEELTSEALRDAVKKLAIHHRPLPDKKPTKWFERFMNRLGWHRTPEIYIVKDSAFNITWVKP